MEEGTLLETPPKPVEKKPARKSNQGNLSGILCPDCFTDGKASEMKHHSCFPLNFGGYAEVTLRYKCPTCSGVWYHKMPQMKKMQSSNVAKEELYE